MVAPHTILQNRYKIIHPIAEGGMGAVYLGTDLRFDNTVALKENLLRDERLGRAFEREAQMLNKLMHPALPKVIDYFIETSGQFLVMEFIPGDDLGTVLAERRDHLEPKNTPKGFAVDDVLIWADQLLDALDYLHTSDPQIIHRDIKPQNLKLTKRGQIILLDFGLAKGSPIHPSQAASSGSIMGFTPSYAPVEQIYGTGTDPRSDLYSLGATLYHLFTGSLPMDAHLRAMQVLTGKPDVLGPASRLNPEVPVAIADILMQAMALDADQRPATAIALRRALRLASRTAIPAADNYSPTAIVSSDSVEISTEAPIAVWDSTELIPQPAPGQSAPVEPLPAPDQSQAENEKPAALLPTEPMPVPVIKTNAETAQRKAELAIFKQKRRLSAQVIIGLVVALALIIGGIWAVKPPTSSDNSASPSDAVTFSKQGDSWFAQYRYAEAEVEYRAALKINPYCVEAHIGLGNVFYNQRKDAEAEAEYQAALRFDSNDVDLRTRLGNVFFNQQKYAEAEAEYRAALKINPNFANARNSLNLLLNRKK